MLTLHCWQVWLNNMNKKLVYGIDALLLVGTLGLVVWAFMFARPILGAPEDGFTTTGAVLFRFEKGDTLLIDDTPEFVSPQRIPVHDQALITLEPGTYYWKVEGTLPSEIRQITVESLVELRVRKSDEGYAITNGGNSQLNVDVYDKGVLTGQVVLAPDQTDVAEGDQFVGGHDD